MVKRMLVDATHPEETRVVVLDGTRLEEFDVETSTKKQNKGNIYLAKVVRVEPSLQAAFVDYGGNRHGFLAFSEIHPDYYQIPVADRERLLEEVHRHAQEDEAADAADDLDPEESNSGPSHDESKDEIQRDVDADEKSASATPLPFTPPAITDDTDSSDEPTAEPNESIAEAIEPTIGSDEFAADETADKQVESEEPRDSQAADSAEQDEVTTDISASDEDTSHDPETHSQSEETPPTDNGETDNNGRAQDSETKPTGVETVGGEDEEDDASGQNRKRRRFLASRHYKIQEVIKRRQIMLVQVVKEERGNKGAALTTFLSLAGRYCVLMPNSARGGGVSRKITSAQDRRRLKAILGDLELPSNMAVILRTAGAERNKSEIKRDYEYLLRTWNSIREVTMTSRAPALIHEEASLIKRAIRDIYSRDIEEVWVDGEEGYKTAKDFMKMLTPSHAKKVQKYKDEIIPLFHRYQVESQLETINNPVIQLKSGGSIVFAQTEALVAIDVNSGRSTKERHIEETAYRTNLEAAEEIARQLRLRDLAGLVVIDFIDMEENRNNHAVERRLKEALRADRARIQVGRISHFGLLELSRQRLRPSLIEANFRVCSHCSGSGLVRSTESAAVHSLRILEEEGVRQRSSEVTITVHSDVALYLLNYKRDMLASIESRYNLKIYVLGDDSLVPPNANIDRVKASRVQIAEHAAAQRADSQEAREEVESEDTEDDQSIAQDEIHADATEDDEDIGSKKRRRRRKRRRGGDSGQTGRNASQMNEGSTGQSETPASAQQDNDVTDQDPSVHGEEGDADVQKSDQSREGRRGRRRGRRGGRRRRGGSKRDAHTEDQSSENDVQTATSTDSQHASSPSYEGNSEQPTTAIQGEPKSERADAGQQDTSENGGPSRLFRPFWKRADSSASSERPAAAEVQSPSESAPSKSSGADTEASPRRGWWQHDASE